MNCQKIFSLKYSRYLKKPNVTITNMKILVRIDKCLTRIEFIDDND